MRFLLCRQIVSFLPWFSAETSLRENWGMYTDCNCILTAPTKAWCWNIIWTYYGKCLVHTLKNILRANGTVFKANKIRTLKKLKIGKFKVQKVQVAKAKIKICSIERFCYFVEVLIIRIQIWSARWCSSILILSWPMETLKVPILFYLLRSAHAPIEQTTFNL